MIITVAKVASCNLEIPSSMTYRQAGILQMHPRREGWHVSVKRLQEQVPS